MQAHLLNALVNSSIDAIACGNSTGCITLFNPAAERLFGYSKKEALGQPFTLLVREQDRVAQRVLFKRFLRTGKSQSLGVHREAIAQHKNGRIFPVIMSLSVDKIEDEYLFTTIMHDITDRRNAEGKLRLYHNIVASTSDPMALLNREFVYQAVNPAFLKTVNKTVDEVEGSTPVQILGQETFEKTVRPHAERCLAGEVVDFKHWLTFPGADPKFMRIHYYPYHNSEGVIDGFVMNARDITKHHNAEESLSLKQAQLHTLLETSRQINHTLDQTSIRKTLVTAACKLLSCDSGAAGIVDGDCMLFHEYLNMSQWIPLDYRFTCGFGVPGHVLQTREPYLTNNAEHDPHVVPEIRQALDFHRLVDVPIIARSGEILGCFEIHDRSDGLPFTNTDVDLLQGLAASAAVALENTRLVEGQKYLIKTLQEKESQLRGLLESANDAILLVDLAQRQFVEVNGRACKLLGFSHQELLNSPIADILPSNNDLFAQFIDHVKASGANKTDQLSFTSREGDIIPTEVSASILQYEGKACMLAMVRDISERKTHERQLQQSLEGTIQAITLAIEARDPYTAGHERRVAELALAVGHELGMDQQQLHGIRFGALIHDIGKIQLPAEILSKPTRLTALEYGLIQGHAQVGYDILKDVVFPWPVADIARQHHERMDGSGYPQGLQNGEICMEARVVAVADVVEAMSSHRPYRPAMGIDKALGEIRRGRGRLFDSTVVDACLTLFAEQLFSFVQTDLSSA